MGAKEQGVKISRKRYQVIPRTLIFLTHGEKILLLKGAPDKRIWANRYNGIGGHVERGETVQEAALREIREETGLRQVENLRLRGTIMIDAGDPTIGIVLFVFTARSPTTNVTASREGSLEWLDRHNLPVASLVEDLTILLPRVLSMDDTDPPFHARYWYDESDRLQISFSSG